MIKIAYGFNLARRAMVLGSALIAGCCTLSAQADAPAGPPPAPPAGGMHRHGPNPERELRELTHVLTLTEAQRVQVLTLLDERSQQVEALRNPAGSDASIEATRPSRDQMESIRQATDIKIAALLNEDQKAKFGAWQSQRKERRERHGGPGAGGPPPPPNE